MKISHNLLLNELEVFKVKEKRGFSNYTIHSKTQDSSLNFKNAFGSSYFIADPFSEIEAS